MSGLYTQLRVMISDFQRRAQTVFGPSTAAFVSAQALAHDYIYRLSRPGADAEGACIELAAGLLDRATLGNEKFWRSPLGRAMAWRIGYPAERVEVRLIGALLGTSRQYGHRVAAGMDKELKDGLVTVPSDQVHRLIRERRKAPDFT